MVAKKLYRRLELGTELLQQTRLLALLALPSDHRGLTSASLDVASEEGSC